jgi:chromate transporter
VLPGAVVMMALVALYAALGQVPLVEAVFLGIKATVVVIVLEALLKVSKRALKALDRWVIAGLSFLAIFAFHLPFPLIIALAAAYGWITARSSRPDGHSSQVSREDRPLGRDEQAPPRTLRTIAFWLALWWAPIAALWATQQELLTQVGLFFSKLAVVTFGGAYAVLAYMTQEVVQDQGWLTTAQMMDGLGLAETTPGPLILVTQFVGFLAGLGAGGWGTAVAGALVTLWVTFVPCFLWIFAGAPYIERISAQPRLAAALQAITAAVVGVILNLSLWFAAHVFFAQIGTRQIGPATLLAPELASLDWRAALLAVLAGVALLGLRWGLFRVLALSAALGVVLSLALGQLG